MTRTGLAEHNVVATFPDLERADQAVAALTGEGVDERRISVLGLHVDRPATHPIDAATTTGGRQGGGAVGAAVGGLVALLRRGRRITLPGVGRVVATGAWAAGAAVGGAVGRAAERWAGGGHLHPDWRATYDWVKEGHVLVGVHADLPKDADQAARTLRRARPERVQGFDSRGRAISVGG